MAAESPVGSVPLRVYRRRLPPALLVMIAVCAALTVLGYGLPGRRSMLILLTSWTSFGVMVCCLGLLILGMLKSPVLLAITPHGLLCPALSPDVIPWGEFQSWRERRIGRCRFLALTLRRPHQGRRGTVRRFALVLASDRGQRHSYSVAGGGVQLRRVADAIRTVPATVQ